MEVWVEGLICDRLAYHGETLSADLKREELAGNDPGYWAPGAGDCLKLLAVFQ
jgi:hypothetical protein